MYQGVSLDQAPPLGIPLRFFYTAPLFGCLGSLVLLLEGPQLVGSVMSGPSIGWLHLWSLGWLTMVMFGAFYQMIPVMIGGRVPWVKLSLGVHFLLSVGVLSFWLHFSWPGYLSALWPLLALGLSILIFLCQTAFALYHVNQQSRPTLEAMRISTCSLAFAVFLGLSRLSEFMGGPGFGGGIREAHLAIALVGWIGLLVIGVSYHLLPMFYVCPAFESRDAYRVIRLISISLILVFLALVFELDHVWVLLASLFGVVGLALYLVRLFQAVSGRRRKKMDPSLRLFAVSMGWLALSLFLWVGGMITGKDTYELAVLVWLFGFGVGATHSMAYKIVPFLIWFHRFSASVGIKKVPTLGDIFPQKKQKLDFWLLESGVICLLVGFAAQLALFLQMAGVLLLMAHVHLLYCYFKAYMFKPVL